MQTTKATQATMTTTYRERRILTAIAECDRYIAKEAPRSADLRPEWAKQYLAFCESHRLKLIAMLAQGQTDTTTA